MEQKLMLGNEAVARGAYEAGANVVSSYPGTPSTEITEFAAKYPEMYVEWAVNEKVAMEVCAGASLGGARALTCMKHVGVNVAADPLFTLSYTGVNGGLVVACADDPGMHSSQNEQDSRYYARAAHLPMLEPCDSKECRDFAVAAFALSEQFDTPVMLRLVTRVSHARSLVDLRPRADVPLRDYKKDIAKNVMMPAMARGRHVALEKRMAALCEYVETAPQNRVEMRETKIGVICAGIAYEYVREALPEASVLKLGIVNPLPRKLIEKFASSVDTLYVVEELEPVIEEQIASWGVPVQGKNLTGLQGELSVRRVREIFGREAPKSCPAQDIPGRPPVMCAGCPHRGPYTVLKKLGVHVSGDIGCYTLGALPPVSAVDSVLCMGASVGMAQGVIRARGDEYAKKSVAVIGDSTFLHSGVTSLINAAYNQSPETLIILDNRITGMTGHQPNPASGKDIHGNPAPELDLEALCRACGVKRVQTVDAFDMKALEAAIKDEMNAGEVSVIIARQPCALLNKKNKRAPYHVNTEKCRGCFACMRVSCPAIEKKEGKAYIDVNQCAGCALCLQTCPFGAIEKAVSEQ